MSAELVITARKCRAAGIGMLCGVRPFCERNNIDFKRFMREGITETELRNTGDAQAVALINRIKRLEKHG